MTVVSFKCLIPRKHLRYQGHEKVALLVGHHDDDMFTVRHVVPVPNRAPNTVEDFAVMIEDARILIGSMSDHIIGAIHSHPAHLTSPSGADLEMIPDGMIGGVFAGYHVTSWYMRNRPLRAVRVEFPTMEWAAS